MPDELPVNDGAPEANPNQAQPDNTDWQKRYTDTHANWNELNERMARFKSDPNAVIEFIRETHPDLLAGEEEDDDPDEFEVADDPVAPLNAKLERFENWQQQVESERAEARFTRDLKQELGDETVPEKVSVWIKDRTAALGNNPKALKQAVEEYREFAGEIRGPVRKQTPTPPPPGTAGDKKRDPRNRDERRARMAAAIEAQQQ